MRSVVAVPVLPQLWGNPAHISPELHEEALRVAGRLEDALLPFAKQARAGFCALVFV